MSTRTIDTYDVNRVRNIVNHLLIPDVNRFRQWQNARGCVVTAVNEASSVLLKIVASLELVCRTTNQLELAAAFAEDAQRWLAAGIDNVPDFSTTRSAYEPGDSGDLTILVAPLTTTNGSPPPGVHLECLLTQLDTPPTCHDLAEGLACRFGRFIAGSTGFSRGNSLVCFSEQVAGEKASHQQGFALFLLNKFNQIYRRQTLPVARHLFGERSPLTGDYRWASDGLSPYEMYAARCVWAAAHEQQHQRGPRPLHANLRQKLNWYCGLLEELKVDIRVVLEAQQGQLPAAETVMEFVLLDRMLRYPRHPEATRNFDAGSGFLLFEHLANHGAIRRPSGARHLLLDPELCFRVLAGLAEQIEQLETHEDSRYRAEAEQLVRSLLPVAKAPARFHVPKRYQQWVRPEPTHELLTFESLEF